MAKRIQDFRNLNSSNKDVTSTEIKVEVASKPKQKEIVKSTKPKIKKEKKVKEKSQTSSGNKLLTTLFALLIIIGIALGCLFSPTFELTDVMISDGVNVTREEIAKTFYIKPQINVFKIDYKEIKKSVESLPYIQKANPKLVFPNRIRIEYTEREPVALIKYLESYLVMDKYGYILEIIRKNKFEDLPIIYNIEFKDYEIGKQLDDTAKTKYDNVVYMLEIAKQNKFKYTIAEINYESIGNVKLWLNGEDVEIIYGKIDKNIISDKLSYIEGILENIKGKSGRLDVSSEDYLKKSVFTERL